MEWARGGGSRGSVLGNGTGRGLGTHFCCGAVPSFIHQFRQIFRLHYFTNTNIDAQRSPTAILTFFRRGKLIKYSTNSLNDVPLYTHYTVCTNAQIMHIYCVCTNIVYFQL